MTKNDLKKLIKEVLNEAKPTSKEASYPVNVAADQIGAALRSNPLYKGVRVAYFTSYSDNVAGSVYADLTVDGGGHIFFSTFDAPEISVNIYKGPHGSDISTQTFDSVADAIKFSKNPMSAFEESDDDELKGAEVLSVVDKGDYGKFITLVTDSGKKITGKFSPKK